MSDRQKLELALSMAEVSVQDMAEAGLLPRQIAIGLAWQVKKQVELAMPTEITRKLFLEALLL